MCLTRGIDKLDLQSCSGICSSLIKQHQLEKLKSTHDQLPYKEKQNLLNFSFERKDLTKKKKPSPNQNISIQKS